MSILTNSPNQSGESDDQHALDHFAKALGKNRPCRLRAVKKGRGAKLIGDDLSRAEKLNSQGYDIYTVINDGGTKMLTSRVAQHYSWNLTTSQKTFK